MSVDVRFARHLRRQMHIFDLLALIVKVVAVDVEKRVERHVEALAREDLGRLYEILPVDLNPDVFPGIFGEVADREALALKLKWRDLRCLAARGDGQAQAHRRKHGGRGVSEAHGL